MDDDSVPIILVIEDDEAIQTLAEDALADAGFELAIAPSGEEALLMGRKGKYRALVTDIHLRGKIDGWDVAQRVREIDPAFPVIYISGISAADWPSKGVPHSIMLAKPFAPAQLVTAISNLQQRHADRVTFDGPRNPLTIDLDEARTLAAGCVSGPRKEKPSPVSTPATASLLMYRAPVSRHRREIPHLRKLRAQPEAPKVQRLPRSGPRRP